MEFRLATPLCFFLLNANKLLGCHHYLDGGCNLSEEHLLFTLAATSLFEGMLPDKSYYANQHNRNGGEMFRTRDRQESPGRQIRRSQTSVCCFNVPRTPLKVAEHLSDTHTEARFN